MKLITAKFLSSVCGAALFCCLCATTAQAELTVPATGNQPTASANSASAQQAQQVQKNLQQKRQAASSSGASSLKSLNFTSSNTVKGNINAANSAQVNIGGVDLSEKKGNATPNNNPAVVEQNAFQVVDKDNKIIPGSPAPPSPSPSDVVKLSQVNIKIGEMQKTMQDIEACQKQAEGDLDRSSLQIQHDVISGALGELKATRQALKDGLVDLAPSMRTEGITTIDTSKIGTEINRLRDENAQLKERMAQATTEAAKGAPELQMQINQQKIDAYNLAQADLRSLSVGLNPYEKCSGQGQQETPKETTKFSSPVEDSSKNSAVAYYIVPAQKDKNGNQKRYDSIFNPQHLGYDYTAKCGLDIGSIYPGVVADVIWDDKLGNVVVIEHGTPDGGKFYSLYAHLANTKVEKGDTVSSGQSIATMGATGTGAKDNKGNDIVHLHMMVWSDNENIPSQRGTLVDSDTNKGKGTTYAGKPVTIYNPEEVIKRGGIW